MRFFSQIALLRVRFPENVAGGDVGDSIVRRNFCGLGAFACSRRAEDEEVVGQGIDKNGSGLNIFGRINLYFSEERDKIGLIFGLRKKSHFL